MQTKRARLDWASQALYTIRSAVLIGMTSKAQPNGGNPVL